MPVADPTLPEALAKDCGAAHRKLVEDLAKHLDKVARLTGLGRTQEALFFLDVWYDSDDEGMPPDPACLCEGGVCRG